MAVTIMGQESEAPSNSFEAAKQPRTLSELKRGEEAEVLEYLAKRPIHTVFLATLIRDNGLVSPYNRGLSYPGWFSSTSMTSANLTGQSVKLTLTNIRTSPPSPANSHSISYLSRAGTYGTGFAM